MPGTKDIEAILHIRSNEPSSSEVTTTVLSLTRDAPTIPTLTIPTSSQPNSTNVSPRYESAAYYYNHREGKKPDSTPLESKPGSPLHPVLLKSDEEDENLVPVAGDSYQQRRVLEDFRNMSEVNYPTLKEAVAAKDKYFNRANLLAIVPLVFLIMYVGVDNAPGVRLQLEDLLESNPYLGYMLASGVPLTALFKGSLNIWKESAREYVISEKKVPPFKIISLMLIDLIISSGLAPLFGYLLNYAVKSPNVLLPLLPIALGYGYLLTYFIFEKSFKYSGLSPTIEERELAKEKEPLLRRQVGLVNSESDDELGHQPLEVEDPRNSRGFCPVM